MDITGSDFGLWRAWATKLISISVWRMMHIDICDLLEHWSFNAKYNAFLKLSAPPEMNILTLETTSLNAVQVCLSARALKLLWITVAGLMHVDMYVLIERWYSRVADDHHLTIDIGSVKEVEANTLALRRKVLQQGRATEKKKGSLKTKARSLLMRRKERLGRSTSMVPGTLMEEA